MECNFNEFVDRRGTDSLKWGKISSLYGNDDILPMWVADMDFKSCETVIEAFRERIDHGVFGYVQRDDAYYQAIIHWLESRHQWKIDKDWIVPMTGVVMGLSLAVRLFTEPGDTVIVQPPVYPPFFQVIQKNQRVVVENNLINEDGQYRMDFDDLEKKIKDGAKAIILCSPHNPVGRVWDRETLEKLGNLCIEHGVLIISDEIHSDLVFESSHHTPIASLSETIKNNTITLMAPSKTFNIAGLAASYAIVPNNELRQKCVAELEAMAVSTTTIFSTLGLTTTYTHGGKWLDQLMPYVEENSHYAVDYIEKNIPQVKAYVPDGTYLLWLDFSELGKDQQSVQEALIQIGKVALNSGSDYGQVGDGFFRLNIGCSREVLKEGLERIKKAVVYLTE